eukprot:CAMPEP_0181224692 /NCGR_PEP_ID=MMETSP1096-20121128/31268_1 /TAXON_ID=156174 ORGANISM="Chrysochromulina ericina, Strain CCMP281" /NCGR_SAMPLE_ID=MMETSP1096 /ASSEMBLY_ACC=CAM_ASM_000453 /LENGTH=110 /DNA_ID=CAMNT_0023317803 /DNA_START=312 /DNA_END=645 /DNA_ORIENTATION=-
MAVGMWRCREKRELATPSQLCDTHLGLLNRWQPPDSTSPHATYIHAAYRIQGVGLGVHSERHRTMSATADAPPGSPRAFGPDCSPHQLRQAALGASRGRFGSILPSALKA